MIAVTLGDVLVWAAVAIGAILAISVVLAGIVLVKGSIEIAKTALEQQRDKRKP